MIFQELVLTNVGPFGGRQAMRMAPKEPDRPIVLFGGLNGTGKTTVLEALLLALYGTLTPGSARRATGYDRYLAQLINHRIDPSEGASIELLFRAVHDGAWQEFRLVRRWSFVGERLKETVEVSRDGYPDQVLTDGWSDHVETLAPRGVANLFFFDGEQIEAFAEPDVSQELVRTAISGLLGLDLVDRLQEDLIVLERRQRQEAAPEEDQRAIAAMQREIAQMKEAELELMQSLEEAERTIKLAHQDLEAAKTRLSREGIQHYKDRDRLQKRRQDADGAWKQAKAALVEALAGFGPLLLVPDLLASTVEQASAERRQAENQAFAKLLAERDDLLLAELVTHRVSAKAQTLVEEFLAQDRHNRESHSVVALLAPDDATHGLAQRLLAEELDSTQQNLSEKVRNIEKARRALDNAERAAAAIPDTAVGEHMVAEFESANETLAEARTRAEQLAAFLNEAKVRRAQAERALHDHLKAAADRELQAERVRRILDHSNRARNTLATLRAKATQRHVQRIQSMVLDSLQLLLRKENLVRDVVIDPDTCFMDLLTHDGRPVRPRTLSAGERQLLAVALLAGLARASGRMLPVVIDTPLGRLDRDHRERFVQSYLPSASHQVIVLSTDTEITPELLESLEPHVSHTLRLEHDPATTATKVAEGSYFGSAATRLKKAAGVM